MNRSLRPFAFLALAALAVRAPLLLLSPQAHYFLQGQALAAALPGPGLFSDPGLAGREPLLPLAWLLLKALEAGRSLLGGPPALWYRLPGLAGDIAVSLALYALVRRRRLGGDPLAAERAGLLAGLSWALNPLAMLLSAAQGASDSLPLALLLGAAWWLEYSQDPRAEAWAALSLGAAAALHPWALALLPLALGAFATSAERRRFAAWVLLPGLLLLLPWLWLDSPEDLAARLLAGGGLRGSLGLSGALRAGFLAAGAPAESADAAALLWRGLALLGLALGVAAAWRRCSRLRLLEGLPWGALGLTVLSPGLGAPGLAWAPALACLLSPLLAWRLSLGGLALALAGYALFHPEVLAGERAWAPQPGPGLLLGWMLLLLAAWAWSLWEWSRLGLPAAASARGRR